MPIKNNDGLIAAHSATFRAARGKILNPNTTSVITDSIRQKHAPRLSQSLFVY